MKRSKIAHLGIVALVVVSCGGDVGEPTTTGELAPSSTQPAATTSTVTTTPIETTTSSESVASSTTPTTLAGQEIDFGPANGDVLMVIGVRYDDSLNLRAGPGADQPIRDEIPPTSMSLLATGHTRELSSSFWTEVEHDGKIGWVHMSYIGYEGDVSDETSAVVAELGENPIEKTMTELGRAVADLYVATDVPSQVVQVTDVAIGDLAEVTYDVIGLGDDAVRGVRLHVFAQEIEDGFALKSVEMTTICGRGVDADRACV